MKTAWEEAGEIFREVEIASICLVRDAEPHIFIAYVAANADLDLYFLSSATTEHGIVAGPAQKAAAALYDSTQEWDTWKRGIQVWGTVTRLHGQTATKARVAYEERFEAYRRWKEEEGVGETLGSMYQYSWERMRILSEPAWGEEGFRDLKRERR